MKMASYKEEFAKKVSEHTKKYGFPTKPKVDKKVKKKAE